MNHVTGCVCIGLSSLAFSVAHWGKPLKADLLMQVLAALFLTAGLAMVVQ